MSKFLNTFDIVNEVEQKHVDLLNHDLKSLLDKDKLPFNHIFGKSLRIAEPLKAGKEYENSIAKHFDEHEIDFPNWVGFKKTDQLKKNPIRLGKLLNNKKLDIQKLLKNPNLSEDDKKQWNDRIGELDILLRTSNLQKQWENSATTKFTIVYSRAPIDVLRMGDFRYGSCHSPQGSYFKCAVADAMLNAGIIYLVENDDFEEIEDRLQDEEIFKDSDRSVRGVTPVARFRLRALIDEQGNTLAVPVLRLYSNAGTYFNTDFRDQVIQWAKKQKTDNYNWDDSLSLPGGSYEDSQYEIDKMVQLIWGKSIDYKHDPSAEGDLDAEFEALNDQEYERFMDRVYDEIRDDSIETEIFGSETSNFLDVSVNFTKDDDICEVDIRFGPAYDFDKIMADNNKKEELYRFGNIKFQKSKSLSNYWVLSIKSEPVEISDHVDYYGGEDGYYNIEKIVSKIAEASSDAINNFVGLDPAMDDDADALSFMIEAGNQILKTLNIKHSLGSSDKDDFYDLSEAFLATAYEITEEIELPSIEGPNGEVYNYRDFGDYAKYNRSGVLPESLRKYKIQDNLLKYVRYWVKEIAKDIQNKYDIKFDLSDSIYPKFFLQSADHSYGHIMGSFSIPIITHYSKDGNTNLSFALHMSYEQFEKMILSGDADKFTELLEDIRVEDYIPIDDVVNSLNKFYSRLHEEMHGQEELKLKFESFRNFFNIIHSDK